MKRFAHIMLFLYILLEIGAIVLFLNGQLKLAAFFLLVMTLSIGIGTSVLQIKKMNKKI